MKKNIKQLCIIIMYGTICCILTSCSKQITFTFSLQCSEDLLDFVSPIVTYVDKKDDLQNVCLKKSDFNVRSTETSITIINDSEPIVVVYNNYNWEKQIVIKAESACRSMKVSYQLRDDAPIIDESKTYIMYHVLTSKHNVINGNDPLNINLSLNINDDSNVKKVSGEDLKAYLDDLQDNPDNQVEQAQ